jgi:lysophospholipase L1-like esterase
VRRGRSGIGLIASLAVATGACGAADEDSPARDRRASVQQSVGTASAQPIEVASAPPGEPMATAPETPQPEAPPEPAWEPEPNDPREARFPIDDPGGTALDHFYDALARTDDAAPGTPDALTRVVHMGDSSIGMDQLPHYLRRPFQERFGDGGTGFVLLQPHSPSYRNQTVQLATPSPWDFCFIIFRCLRDGHYGLGGVAATSRGGATTVIRTGRDGDHVRTASRAELWYAGQPRGGRVELRIDRGEPIVIDTEAPALEARYHEVDLEPGPHHVRVRAIGGGLVRAYGVVLENDGPGVVWDTLSMIGAFTPRLLDQDEAHFRDQLERRRANLVVLGYGGNDLRRFAGRGVPADQIREETRQLIERVRSSGASCLLTSIVEHVFSGQARITSDDVEALVNAQREAAHQAGCAYFDVYAAMGGRGSFLEWQRRGLAADDGKHLSPAGRRRVAELIYEALLAGYVAHRTRG